MDESEIDIELKAGDLVRVIENDKLGIIAEYNDDLCGWGCCNGYRLHGDVDLWYWKGQLELIK